MGVWVVVVAAGTGTEAAAEGEEEDHDLAGTERAGACTCRTAAARAVVAAAAAAAKGLQWWRSCWSAAAGCSTSWRQQTGASMWLLVGCYTYYTVHTAGCLLTSTHSIAYWNRGRR